MLLTGGTTGFIGCIACDGQPRFIAPGVPYMQLSSDSLVSMPLPAGTLQNLRVKLSTVDPGQHSFQLFVNGGGTAIGCATFNPFSDRCQSTATLAINSGDVISIAIGEGGIDFSGNETARFSLEFIPAP